MKNACCLGHSRLLAEGVDVRIIQERLDHEDSSTTQVYTNADRSHLQAVYEKFHPRAL